MNLAWPTQVNGVNGLLAMPPAGKAFCHITSTIASPAKTRLETPHGAARSPPRRRTSIGVKTPQITCRQQAFTVLLVTSRMSAKMTSKMNDRRSSRAP